ncbi:alveolar macrophage chemotactic factor [Nothobranchius furzeri]|uniref:Alveolar macrophage chemotactic factor-like n=1 Tax=Nothobranchius furzeri TaxID=105023 RepID=A0A1A8B061_NOTFU|nr:alveolar macrophage chemotactic factor-like [Nothobranchius furzeri]
MKSSTAIAFSIMVVLTFLGFSEGRSVRSLGVEPHCRCIETESRRIGPRIAKFELISANSHCERLEIIATLKQSGKEVCLNPEAPWVRKLIENMIPKKPTQRHVKDASPSEQV